MEDIKALAFMFIFFAGPYILGGIVILVILQVIGEAFAPRVTVVHQEASPPVEIATGYSHNDVDEAYWRGVEAAKKDDGVYR